MTRRDTIIVAILINAGLLVVLFVSALKNDMPALTSQDVKADKQSIVTKKESPISKTTPDQVDQLLAQYAKKTAKEIQEEPRKIEAAKVIAEKQEASVAREENKVIYSNAPEKAPEPLQTDLDKVVVKKGDVLEKIAKQYGVSVEKLMQANDLKDSRLQIGQVIYIPKEKAKAVSSIKALPQKTEEAYYIVKNGDNLWKIAIENHVKVEDLLKLNQLNEKQAKALRPGDRLRIK